MKRKYTDEKNAQVVIALLKVHRIRKIIASPGTMNMAIVASVQGDPYFEMYSAVDERSAAYMACGLAAESGEPVVISCTGATASRNYLPGLTEAFYRKLPVLAITSTQVVSKVGHHVAQVIDRSTLPKDVVKISVTLPIVKDDNDLWDCEIKVNKAILELTRYGNGPVHINLPTINSQSYNINTLPKVRVIDRITVTGKYPELPKSKIAVFVGAHSVWTDEQTKVLDQFCASNDAVVFCDHSSNYKGKYRVLFPIVTCQQMNNLISLRPDVLIHVGEISGGNYSQNIVGNQVWRVSEDGEIRDTFGKLRYVFEMPEQAFFEFYSQKNISAKDSYLNFCNDYLTALYKKIPELPFSNIWVASKMAHRIPDGSTIHFGILNSLRSWNFFELPQSVSSSSNVGGFGIDGGVSSLIGASLSNKNKLYFGVFGDLAFFYDMNSIGNRHIGNNIRILLINNGKGTEFRRYNHIAAHFGDAADNYIAAAGHFGNKSVNLVKHYSSDLGFKYLCASNKQEFDIVYDRFIEEVNDRPILFEIFTNNKDESDALQFMMSINDNIKGKTKQMAKKILSENALDVIKGIMRKK